MSQELVLGIDLGTTYSAMAWVTGTGKPEIVVNAEGRPTTPSVVHFYDHEGVVVGEEATKMVALDPENIVRFVKRNMGDATQFEFFGQPYSPQEVSAFILRKLKKDAEMLLGVEIRDAVITVPAYFNSAQRGATSEAGTIAGLNVLSIINEPTAAAIAYGLDRLGEDRNLLIFDLGGGTFDVTVMKIRGTTLTTIASDGNAELGGKDWDDRIMDFVSEQFFSKFRLDPRDTPSSYQELYERVLNSKISLSTKDRSVVPVNYRGQRLMVPVTRDLFEDLTRDLVQQCEDTANIVLEKAEMQWSELDNCLLVGGSTRMPMVRRLIQRLAGKPPSDEVNPDQCVALGAALAGVFRHRPEQVADVAPPIAKRRNTPVVPDEGANIQLEVGVRDTSTGTPVPGPNREEVTIEDASTHPLGIVVLDQQRNERVVELIPEGTLLPHEYRGRFAYAYENMRAVRVEVTEGVGSARDEVTVIGKVELTGLPPRPRGTPIEVIYRYSANQILSVHVIDVETGKSRAADIRFSGGLDRRQLERARKRNRGISVD